MYWIPFYKRRNWGSERFDHLPRITQLVSRISTPHLVTQKLRLFNLYIVWHRKHSGKPGPLGDCVWSQPGVLRKGCWRQKPTGSCCSGVANPSWLTCSAPASGVCLRARRGCSGFWYITPNNPSPILHLPPGAPPPLRLIERSCHSQAASHPHRTWPSKIDYWTKKWIERIGGLRRGRGTS